MNLTKPPITIDQNRTAVAPVDALEMAADVLEEEANQLADPHEGMPHRKRLAITREIVRLRLIASELRRNIPKVIDQEPE